MRKTEAICKYVVEVMALILVLFLISIGILGNISAKDNLNYMPIEQIADAVDNQEKSIAPEGIAILEEYQAFAMLMNENGDIIWSYQKPEELPTYYTRKDIAVFSRWYYRDYPITTYVVGDDILVVGQQKHSMWKLQLCISEKTINEFIRIVPILFIVNILIVIMVPFFSLKRDARNKEKLRTTWIAGVSHDIRTPLALVLGYSNEMNQLLEEIKLEDTDSVKMHNHTTQRNLELLQQKVTHVEEQSLRMRTLITNLNMESKLAYGMGKWKKEEILLPAVIRDVMCDFLNRSYMENYDFGCDIAEELEQFTVTGDSDLIKRMMENLLNNAVNHNPSGCTVEVILQETKNMQNKQKLSMRERIYVITHKHMLVVQDSGCGVAADVLKELSRPFSYYHKMGEHGLGTRLVRLIVMKHKWKVTFNNRDTGGFVCRIWI